MNTTQHQSHTLWRVWLFDGPILADAAGNEVCRFRSRRVGALLAYLALHLGKRCPREELYEAIWPEENTQVISNRLRVALASLRRQLEPSGVPFGTVIDVSTPGQIRLRPETVWCDVVAFETFLKTGQKEAAARLMRGTLLPGYYDEWAITARERYETLQEGLEDVVLPAPVVAAQTAPANHATLSHRVPFYLTRFFGREAEQQCLLALLQTNRLVTITGPGGIGKTRLAVETTRSVPWTTVFVPLADVRAAERLPEAILNALLVPAKTDADLDVELVTTLRERGPTVLILDNTEGLLTTVAPLVWRLLEEVSALRLLITARQRLDVQGEALLPLKPLELPPAATEPELICEYPAAALFLDRARAILPDFVFNSRHSEALIEICQRLEGLPLALELAAARVSTQTLGQIAQSLQRNATNLKSRQQGLAKRHQSLQMVLETSLELLPEEVRSFFFALARFPGDWTIESAHRMTGCTRSEEYLELLVASSLAERREDEQQSVVRFALRETLRHLALQTAPNVWDEENNLLVNGSFEADRPDANWQHFEGGPFPYPFIVAFGWKGIGSVNVNMPSYVAFPGGIPEGSNTAVVGDHHMGAGRLFQEVAEPLTAGTTYLLTAWVGNRLHYSGSGRVRLETLSGHILADSGTVWPAEGTFQQVSLAFTAHEDSVGLGEGLRVVLERVDGVQANFDCVSLTTFPAETPAAEEN